MALVLVWPSTDMEYHRLGGLNNKNVFLTVLEAGKSKIKAPADPVYGEGTFSGLQMVLFLYPHWQRAGKEPMSPSSSSSSSFFF